VSGRFGNLGAPTGCPIIFHIAFVGAGYSTFALVPWQTAIDDSNNYFALLMLWVRNFRGEWS
ncbi:MAG: hypothetical protein WB005_23855, partial [Pseudolabrys sp.]